MSDYQPEDTISEVFWHHNTGVANGSFTKTLYKNQLVCGYAVTVTELSGGFYKFSFDTDADDEAVYELDIVETADTSRRHQGTWKVWVAEPVDVVRQNGETNSVPGNMAFIRKMVVELYALIRAIATKLP